MRTRVLPPHRSDAGWRSAQEQIEKLRLERRRLRAMTQHLANDELHSHYRRLAEVNRILMFLRKKKQEARSRYGG